MIDPPDRDAIEKDVFVPLHIIANLHTLNHLQGTSYCSRGR
jgi:hypothetical protein